MTRDAADPNSRRGRRGAANQFPPVDEERAFEIIDVLRKIASRHNASPAQVALAWVLAQPIVSSAIIGAKRVDQLTDNLGAIELNLTAEDLTELDKASTEPPRYPQWMLTFGANARVPAGHPFDQPSWMTGQPPLRPR